MTDETLQLSPQRGNITGCDCFQFSVLCLKLTINLDGLTQYQTADYHMDGGHKNMSLSK